MAMKQKQQSTSHGHTKEDAKQQHRQSRLSGYGQQQQQQQQQKQLQQLKALEQDEEMADLEQRIAQQSA
jgi:hypothetical protein